MSSPETKSAWQRFSTLNVMLALIGLLFVWSYWPTFVDLADEWWNNPLYSHGYLVPFFSAVLLWVRRDRMPRAPLEPSWLALFFLLVVAAMRLGSAYFYFSWPDRGSILVLAIAVTLAIGGWPAFKWAWPSILFLFFMLPFPGFVETRFMGPLQRIATLASTNLLQTMGIFAQADGNVILLSESQLGVVEACSGLRMLSTFIALTVGASFFLQRPAWQKLVVVASSIPIALVCNIARITATGVFMEFVGNRDLADKFHDQAGLAMPVLALGLLYLELKILDLIFIIEPAAAQPAGADAGPLVARGALPA